MTKRIDKTPRITKECLSCLEIIPPSPHQNYHSTLTRAANKNTSTFNLNPKSSVDVRKHPKPLRCRVSTNPIAMTQDDYGLLMDRHIESSDWLDDHVMDLWTYSLEDVTSMLEQVQAFER